MKLMLSTALAVVATATLAAQAAPNVSGKWVLQSGGRGGAPTLTLNQVGTEVNGELVSGGSGGGAASPVNNGIHDGKVENGTLSFYVWRGTDKPYKTVYKGTLNAAGDEITFTVTGNPGRGGAPATPLTLTARRSK